MALIKGTDKADILSGTKANDSIRGKGGDDVLNGGDGDDDLRGGRGNDVLNGGRGDDTLVGDQGDDTLKGGAGDDVYFIERGRVTIVDFSGSDRLIMSLAENLTVLSPNETTTLANGTTFKGIESLDVSVDGTADREIVTNSGNDYVRFGRPREFDEDPVAPPIEAKGTTYTVDLGAGDDFFFSSYSNSSHVIDGGGGLDRAELDFFYAESALTISLAEKAPDVTSPVRLTNFESLDVIGGSGDDTFVGGMLSDSLAGGDGDDVLDGRGGDDFLHGDGGNDTLDGGSGNDWLYGGGGDDTLAGGGGDDRLAGNDGSDTIRGGAGDDEIYGGRNRADLIRAGGGPDRLYGDDGDDYISATSGDSADGGADIDRLFFTAEGDTTFTFTTGTALIDADTTVANFEELSWAGGSGADVVTGGARSDFLEGNDGNDTLKGGRGDDMLADGRGDDRLSGGVGDDVLVRAAEYSDRDGSWTGTDVFDGGAGTDTVRFGTFGLSYHYTGHPEGPTDSMEDLLELYSLRDVRQSATIDLAAQSKNAGLAEGLTLKSIEIIYGAGAKDDLRGADGADTLRGRGGDDRLYGRAGNDRLDGGSGSDRLDGGSGGDRLDGGGGSDRLDGGKGNDTLTGGLGADDLHGGTGADVFVFASIEESTSGNSGRDTIFGFGGADRIDLSAIDASRKSKGDQAFTFIGAEQFSKQAGELRYDKGKSGIYIRADVDGDGKSDFSIKLDGVHSLVKGDFIL